MSKLVRPPRLCLITGGAGGRRWILQDRLATTFRLDLVAAAQEDLVFKRLRMLVQELNPDQRVAAHSTAHRLLGNHDRPAIGQERHLANFLGGVRPFDVVAEDELGAQPRQRDLAVESDQGPRVIGTLGGADLREDRRRQIGATFERSCVRV